MRALALLAAMPVPPGAQEGERLRAVLLEAMRLWPTTPLLSRETTKPLVWHGVQVPAGTNVLISNTFFHRDPRRLGDAADRFTPEGWTNGRFGGDWGLNFFSHGPQGCPGANLALLIGTEVLATLRSEPEPLSLRKPSLELSGALPHMLDVFGIEVGL
jgi:cytochrome P450